MTAAEETGVAPLLRQWRELAGSSVLLDGFHALKHALRFGARVPLALTEDRAAVLSLARELAPDLAGRLEGLLRDVPRGTLHGLVPRPHPTGVAALAVRGGDDLADARTAPVIVLDDPRHLGNVGAVIRLAAGAGAAGVLTTGTVDPWHPNVVRASAGLHFATAVRRCEPPELPPGPLYALDPEGRDLRGLVLPDDAILAFGSERHGLSDALRERADQLVALPMRAQVSSYNLATSVAMTLYHWMAGRAPDPGGPRSTDGTGPDAIGQRGAEPDSTGTGMDGTDGTARS
ncbi:TrmH family RNA methyltransferase [Streptomyces sp. HNM0575]|uniref:TrmH family RNA methyltransferase n=1 Tax=Streptomyces sp. HNM0575 TaxID=2716338 RepID=UPI00145E1F0A|nr:TrmH family RNA methyltransferase [Streptomyces sp. HNM0575]NLU76029.1 TrmH family RNA methyltransferase [Streptomyces sp. HNM0575]